MTGLRNMLQVPLSLWLDEKNIWDNDMTFAHPLLNTVVEKEEDS